DIHVRSIATSAIGLNLGAAGRVCQGDVLMRWGGAPFMSVVKAFAPAGAGNRDDPRLLGRQPGRRNLSGCRSSGTVEPTTEAAAPHRMWLRAGQPFQIAFSTPAASR